MKISEPLLREFDYEMPNTRKELERLPDDKLGWKPHVKSMTMGELATHLARLPEWATMTLATEDFDLAKMDPSQMVPATSREELLAMFDKNVVAARAAIAAASDEQFKVDWTMRKGEQVFFTLPRIAVLRSFVMNHMIHHRAQLGVYLRLNDIPLPPIYGPTADEGMM